MCGNALDQCAAGSGTMLSTNLGDAGRVSLPVETRQETMFLLREKHFVPVRSYDLDQRTDGVSQHDYLPKQIFSPTGGVNAIVEFGVDGGKPRVIEFLRKSRIYDHFKRFKLPIDVVCVIERPHPGGERASMRFKYRSHLEYIFNLADIERGHVEPASRLLLDKPFYFQAI